MAHNTLTVALDVANKTATLTGMIAIREVIDVTLTGAESATAANVRLAIIQRSTNVAVCNTFAATGVSGVYTGELSLNTEDPGIIEWFAHMAKHDGYKTFVLAVWDIVGNTLMCNCDITVYNNPYDPSMEDPTPVDPIGGVTAYAPLENGVTNGDSHDHHGGDGAQINYANLSGLPTIPTLSSSTPADVAEAGDDGSASTASKSDHVHALPAAVAKAAYEANDDTNAYTDADKAKVAAAPGDDATVKSMYEANDDTNAFTDAEKTKLSGIETGADVTDAAAIAAAGGLTATLFPGVGLMKRTGASTYALVATSSFINGWLACADLAAAQAALELGDSASLDVGTDAGTVAAGDHDHSAVYQPLDAELTALAGLTSAANKLAYFTGSGTASLCDLSVVGRAVIAAATAAAQRTALGLGDISTQAKSAVDITGGTVKDVTLQLTDTVTGTVYNLSIDNGVPNWTPDT
jgi:hypothetical protein